MNYETPPQKKKDCKGYFLSYTVTKDMNYIFTLDLSSFNQVTQLFLSHPLLNQLYLCCLCFWMS